MLLHGARLGLHEGLRPGRQLSPQAATLRPGQQGEPHRLTNTRRTHGVEPHQSLGRASLHLADWPSQMVLVVGTTYWT